MPIARARALLTLLGRHHDPSLRPTVNTQKSVCENLIMGQSYEPRKIFLPAGPLLIFGQIWPYPWHNTMVVASGVGLAGMPMKARA
jgi:hypothetical protein